MFYKDASTDYSLFTNSIMKDSKESGTTFLLDTRVTNIEKEKERWTITLNGEHKIYAKIFNQCSRRGSCEHCT